jgi:hypothetical protein
MRLRSAALLKLSAITVILLIACSAEAGASAWEFPINQGPDGGGNDFSVKAASGTDNPATPGLEVDAGSPVTITGSLYLSNYANPDQQAAGTTSGAFPPIPIAVPVYVYLYKDGNIVASKSEVYTVMPVSAPFGSPLIIQQSRDLMVPADLAPGDYILIAHTYVDVPTLITDMFKGSDVEGVDLISATYSRPVTVRNSHYTGASTPTPTPAPANNTVLSSADMSFSGDYLNGILGSPGAHTVLGNGIGGVLTVGSGTDSPLLQLNTDDVSAPDLNGASASIEVNFSKAPNGGSIQMSIMPEPSNDVRTQYVLGAVDSNLEITDIAYVLAVNKTNIENIQYETKNGKLVPISDGAVQNALITMKVSPSWVAAHGGVDAIKIMRYDNGTAEALITHYMGTEGGLMVFQGESPRGLSIFAVCSVNSLSTIAHSEAVAHPPYLINIPFWLQLVTLVLVIAAILVQGFLVVVLGAGMTVQKALRKRKH